MWWALLLTGIARLLPGVSRYPVLLVTIPAFLVDYRGTITGV